MKIKDLPKVSIVTATYNSERFLQKAIDSVATQDYPNIEYIIIDGDSKDNTLNIINKYENLISRVVSEKDQGIYDALNKGVSIAHGEYIAFLHSDDYYTESNTISSIVNELSASQANGIYSDLSYVTPTVPEKIIRKWKSCKFTANLLKKGWMPPHPTLILKKSVYLKHQIAPAKYFNTDYRISADYDFITRLFKDSTLKLTYFPRCTVKMRAGGVSNRNLKCIFRKMYEDYKIIRSNGIGGFLTLINKNLSKFLQFRF